MRDGVEHPPGNSTLSAEDGSAAGADFDDVRQCSVFTGVEQGIVAAVLDHCASQHFKPGETLIEQDRYFNDFKIISRGLVDLTRIEEGREYGVLLLSAHDLLLPAASLFREPSLVSARALTRTKICAVPIDVVRAAMRQSAQLATNLMAVTSGQWRMSVRNTLDLSARSAAQRVASFLLRLADLQSHAITPVLPIAKRHLAARVGITPETLSRMLQTLAEQGLHLRGRAIIVLDRRKIERFCGPDLYIADNEHELGVFAL